MGNGLPWTMVINNCRPPEGFDYWEFVERYNSWHYVFDPVYSRYKDPIVKISGALFISERNNFLIF